MAVNSGVVTVLPAPDGYYINLASPQRQGESQTYSVVGVGVFLGCCFMAQGVYTKMFITRSWQIEDWLLVAGWTLNVSTQIVTVYMFANRLLGIHGWEMPLENYSTFELVVVAVSLFAPATGLSKISILLFYHRISPQAWFQRIVKFMIFVVAGYTIGIFFSMIFACNPVERGWNVAITSGSCINRQALYIATAGLGIATDIILLVIPIPVIIRLQMPKIEKVLAILVFAVGSATLVTSIVRLVVLIPVLTDIDQSWAISFPCLWICVETSLLTICAALPTVRKFVAHFTKGPAAACSHSQRFSKKASLRTWGAPSTRRKYDKFGESEFDMKTLNQAELAIRPDQPVDSGLQVQVEAQSFSWDSQTDIDAESEKGIIQTRTTSVQRSARD